MRAKMTSKIVKTHRSRWKSDYFLALGILLTFMCGQVSGVKRLSLSGADLKCTLPGNAYFLRDLFHWNLICYLLDLNFNKLTSTNLLFKMIGIIWHS